MPVHLIENLPPVCWHEATPHKCRPHRPHLTLWLLQPATLANTSPGSQVLSPANMTSTSLWPYGGTVLRMDRLRSSTFCSEASPLAPASKVQVGSTVLRMDRLRCSTVLQRGVATGTCEQVVQVGRFDRSHTLCRETLPLAPASRCSRPLHKPHQCHTIGCRTRAQ